MAQTVTYLNFGGNTLEAMNFYKDCFGGELEVIPVQGSPVEGEMPGAANGVLHSSLVSGDVRLMASDCETEVKVGNNLSIMVDCSSEEEINRLYANLSAGGSANHPVQPAFWGGLFGHLTDKYGINWLLNCSPQAG